MSSTRAAGLYAKWRAVSAYRVLVKSHQFQTRNGSRHQLLSQED